jgi:hypothetical protein
MKTRIELKRIANTLYRNPENERSSYRQAVAHHPNVELASEELETLYSRFKKNHAGVPDDGGPDGQVKARKLQAEEMKIRAINPSGRVDYSIQE